MRQLCWVRHVSQLLKGTNIKAVTVIGFPFGACSTIVKVEHVRVMFEATDGQIGIKAAGGIPY